MADHLTVGEIAELFGLPTWKVRRAVDALDVEIPRAGNYRLVPRNLLGRIAAEIERVGWSQPTAASSPSAIATA
jgi:hypothetical protein